MARSVSGTTEPTTPPTMAPTFAGPFEVFPVLVGLGFRPVLMVPGPPVPVVVLPVETVVICFGNTSGSRPIFIATVSLYVMLGKDLAFGVGANVSPNGKCVSYCDVVVCPVRNSSSLRDVGRVQ